MSEIQFEQTPLPGGAVLMSERVPWARSLSLGLWFRAGSRDETGPEDGMAHFVEHLAFKGTAKRDALAIARSLEAVGGSLDAFTGRELTCYCTRVLSESLPLAIDVLTDLVGGPTFLEEHVDREKSVVVEEIRGLDDAPEDLIHDLVAARMWRGHPLAGSILGTEDSVNSFTAAGVRDFWGRLYRQPSLIVSLAGGFDLDEARGRLTDLLTLAGGPAVQDRRPPEVAPPALINWRREVSQEYLCLTTPTPGFGDERRYALQILSTVLGGGMSSRLFQKIREEAGLAYTVYSYSDFCQDTGMFGAFLGVSPDKAGAALEMTQSEMVRLSHEGFSQEELDSARAQVRGGVLMGLESLSTRMNRLARSYYYHGRYQTVEELLAIFDRLTVSSVMDQTAEFLDPAQWTLVAYGPAATSELNVGGWTEVEEP
ncbi:MAG: pitrilysin family protein [Candidatus Eisenbacteria bacterium]|nr:pitrilysin family protein [Candidatus Eisenbacteria bacterium]